MKKVFLCIICYMCYSCNNQEEVIEYYPNGQIKLEYSLQNKIKNGYYKEFSENGNLKMVQIYNMGVRNDSSIYYYENIKNSIKTIKFWKNNNAFYQKDFFENKNLMREGNLLRDNFRIGKWNFYNLKKNKTNIIEYYNINNKSYLNQEWKLNIKGDTIEGGNFYTIISKKDTIKYSEPYRIHFFLEERVMLNSEAYICIPKKGYNIENDFSNEFKIKWDTINNISHEFKNHPIYKNRKYDVLFSIMPRKLGKNSLKGYFLEKKIIKNNDSIDAVTRKIYFNIPYFVNQR